MPIPRTSQTLAAALLLLSTALVHAAAPLTPGQPILLEKTTGKFDFLSIDRARKRLLVAHPGNSSLDIIDLEKKTLLKSIATGAAQSAVTDPKGAQYFVGVSKPPQLAIVDADKLTVTATVPLGGPADIIGYNEKSGLVYVGHDDGKELWVIDPKEKKIVGAVALGSEAPEDLAFDASRSRLFQNMKVASVVLAIDTATNKVAQTWPTAPATAPHGTAVDAEAGALLIAGGNGKLVMMSEQDGKVLASAPIPERVDQVAYDPGLHRLYCASGTGKLAILTVGKDQLTPAGEIACPPGTHSVAVDPATHEVWIAYPQGKESFVQPFTATP